MEPPNIENPIVPTTHGFVRGVRRIGIYGDPYFCFERLPFARPPVGVLRFRAPQPPLSWPDVRDCTGMSPKPVQRNLFTGEYEGAEDCLYLNIYVKTLESTDRLPIMFYIYGGAYQNGEATRNLLGPDYLMQERIIVVTCNYRLGPLGFLCLRDPELNVPGNAGLKDILAGLKWVQSNANNFNGDAGNITVFGDSAGGAATHYLMISEKARDLFHKAILMSGTVFNMWSSAPLGDYAYRLAKVCGYEGKNNEKAVLNFLRKMPSHKLVGHDIATEEERLRGHAILFGPTIEPYVTDDCILSEDPLTCTTKHAWGNRLPIMIGGTSSEGLLSYPKAKENCKFWDLVNVMPEVLIPYEIRVRKSLDEAKKLGLQLLKLHFTDTDLTEQDVFKYLDFLHYKGYWHGFVRCIHSRLAYAVAPTYLYRFDYDSATFNFFRIRYCGTEVRGVAHADDVTYLFCCARAWKLPRDSDEYKTIRRMVSMWTSFAIKGNPNCETISPVQWQPVDDNQPYKCLNISRELQLIELPEAQKLKVWNSLYDRCAPLF